MNKLKKESNIKNDIVISFKFVLIILSILLTGKKPPDDIIVIDKLKESRVLRFINFKIKNITRVNAIYKNNILKDSLKNSE